jgi:hypothetical protein
MRSSTSIRHFDPRIGLIALIYVLLYSSGALAAQAAQILLISPSAGKAGDSVTIDGRGFGAQNVTVQVGGFPAAIVSATGNRVVFLVPSGLPAGTTTVRVTNPAGHSSSVAWELVNPQAPRPGVVAVDAAQTVSAVVTRAGATLSTSSAGAAFSLKFPLAALPVDTAISMTPILKFANLPFAGPAIGVRVKPDGLQLQRRGELRITLPQGADPAKYVGFTFNEEGTYFEPLVARIEGTALVLSVEHFSEFGIAEPTPAELEAMLVTKLDVLRNQPSPSRTDVMSLLAAFRNYCAALQRTADPLPCSVRPVSQAVADLATRELEAQRAAALLEAQAHIQAGEARAAFNSLEFARSVGAELYAIQTLAYFSEGQSLDLAAYADPLSAVMDLAGQTALAVANEDPFQESQEVRLTDAVVLLEDATRSAQDMGLQAVRAHGAFLSAPPISATRSTESMRPETSPWMLRSCRRSTLRSARAASSSRP